MTATLPATADAVVLAKIESPVGLLLAGATERGICLLEFSDPERLEKQLGSIRRHYSSKTEEGSNPHLDQLKIELTEYFAGTLREFTVPLDVVGSDFQKTVWQQLRDIPYGETRSYEDIAVAAGSPKSMRAVGTANGQNRIAIVVPCHRVINKGGKLGGYGGGLDRKKFLLDLERQP